MKIALDTREFKEQQQQKSFNSVNSLSVQPHFTSLAYGYATHLLLQDDFNRSCVSIKHFFKILYSQQNGSKNHTSFKMSFGMGTQCQ